MPRRPQVVWRHRLERSRVVGASPTCAGARGATRAPAFRRRRIAARRRAALVGRTVALSGRSGAHGSRRTIERGSVAPSRPARRSTRSTSPSSDAVPFAPQPILQRVQHPRGRRARTAAALLGLPTRFAASRLFGQRDGVEFGAVAVRGALGAKAAWYAMDDLRERRARVLHCR